MATSAISYSGWTSIAATTWTTTLAGGEIATSALVDNSSNLYQEVLISGSINFGASHVDGDTCVLYLLSNYDDATTTDVSGGIGTAINAGDSEQTAGTNITLRNTRLIGVVTADAASTVQHFEFKLPYVPRNWQIAIENTDASAALGGVATLGYRGIKYTSA